MSNARLAELDERAATLLGGGRADVALADDLEELLRLDLRGHPWAKLVMAAALNDLRDERCDALLLSSLRSFQRRHDRRGVGFAQTLTGAVALGRGRLNEAAHWFQLSRESLQEECLMDAANLAHLGLCAYQRGELQEAVAITEEGLAVARIRGARRYEGLACLYLSFFALITGAFSRADTLFGVAEETYLELPDPFERFELPLILAGRAVLATLRGQHERAEGDFTAAITLAEQIKVPWYVAITRVLRAQFTAASHPARSLSDARYGLEQLVAMDDVWWQTWALRAQGTAAREAGDLQASVQVLTRLLTRDLNPLERGLTLLALGETLVHTDHPDQAVSPLEQARALLEPVGARYWIVRCWIVLAEAGPPRAQRRKRALALADDDPAYRHLLAGNSRLRIAVLGDAGVWAGSQRLHFPTHNAELAVLSLALAGSGGLHEEELIERLWPQAPADRGRARLRTVLWQARQTLGREAWRLDRRGQRIYLNLDSATFDLLAARTQAVGLLAQPVEELDAEEVRTVIATLAQPLLVGWQYEAWVEVAAERNAELVRGLGQRQHHP